jgi:hypothetical protein
MDIMSRTEDVFTGLGNEVLTMEARNNPANSHTVSVRLETDQLAKIDALSELLNTTRQEVFSNILFASFDEAIRGAHAGLQIELNEYGKSDVFEKLYLDKYKKLNSKISAKGEK